MSSFSLKIVAAVTMVIDHIGLFFFPQFYGMRIVGRLSFPIFSWLIATGALHTKNIWHYTTRLFGLAVVSQIPYYFAYQKLGQPFKLNVVFSLALSILVIALLKRLNNFSYKVLVIFLGLVMAHFLKFDFGVGGVLSTLTFWLFYKRPTLLIISQILIFGLPMFFYSLMFYPRTFWQIMVDYTYFAPFALFALPFIFLFNGREGPKLKYAFYAFYPLQYITIYFVQLITGNIIE